MKKYCYVNNKISDATKAGIPLHDLGIIRGYGVFDSLVLVHRQPFLFREHFNRLVASAEKLAMKIPLTEEKMEKIVIELGRKNKMKEAAVRTVLTGSGSFFILLEDIPTLPDAVYKKGGKLIIHEHQRILPEAKTTNYITCMKLQPQRIKEKAVEILYISKGKILECATSNFFIFKGNTLITPKRDILLGITRKAVIDLAKKHFKVMERDIPLKEITSATECFITTSFKNVCPILKIGKQVISNGKVGENTKLLMGLYDELRSFKF